MSQPGKNMPLWPKTSSCKEIRKSINSSDHKHIDPSTIHLSEQKQVWGLGGTWTPIWFTDLWTFLITSPAVTSKLRQPHCQVYCAIAGQKIPKQPSSHEAWLGPWALREDGMYDALKSSLKYTGKRTHPLPNPLDPCPSSLHCSCLSHILLSKELTSVLRHTVLCTHQ